MTPEELKAKKRAEIVANLAKARAAQERKPKEELSMNTDNQKKKEMEIA